MGEIITATPEAHPYRRRKASVEEAMVEATKKLEKILQIEGEHND